MKQEIFCIGENHLKLSRRMFVDWDDCEYGAPCINPKRPYGNSDVERDIAELIGYELECDDSGELVFSDVDRRYLRTLHKEMQTALQIWLCTGVIRTGLFRKNDKYDDTSWEFVNG